MKSLTFLLIVGLAAYAKSDDVNVNCFFYGSNTGSDSGVGYVCSLEATTLIDDETQQIVIGGQHVSGYTNEDVRSVTNLNGVVTPFMMNQLFTTFPNLVQVNLLNIGINRVQSGAFNNANHLTFVSLRSNSALTTIHANAFSGATNVQHIDIGLNQIATIDESAFEGLTALRDLHMDANRIVQLPSNIFSTLSSLEIIWIDYNQIETLDNNLFAFNPAIRNILAGVNQISAIGPNLLDNKPNLQILGLQQNQCVDQVFFLTSTTIESVRESLNGCFNNYDENN